LDFDNERADGRDKKRGRSERVGGQSGTLGNGDSGAGKGDQEARGEAPASYLRNASMIKIDRASAALSPTLLPVM
jgi:hypothetical protein